MADRVYGWIPDQPDPTDVRFSLKRLGMFAAPLPPHVDLRMGCPPIYDQEDLGSCTAQAIAAAIQFDEIKLRRPTETPSRLFIYYNERVVMGSVPFDSGAAIRDGMKVINEHGHCEETQWPYNVNQFAVKPPPECYEYAIHHKSLIYEAVPKDLNELKQVLAAGFPIIFGFTVHASFESQVVKDTGFVPLPTPGDPARGGHAVLAVGYDDETELFIVRNSWGSAWGFQGYFLFPYPYMLAPGTTDFWTLRLTR